jgi:uncharacterized protein
VPDEGQEVKLGVPAERLPLEKSELRLVDRVELAGRLDRVDDAAFRLGGSLAVTVELECVRCLEPFRLELDEPLDLLFLPFSANVGPGKAGKPGKPAEPARNEERELKDEDLAVSFYQDEKIDVGLLIREQIYLALPMKPICRDDCQGLCPKCGTNLNSSSCNCAREAVDPRLASLKTLLKS